MSEVEGSAGFSGRTLVVPTMAVGIVIAILLLSRHPGSSQISASPAFENIPTEQALPTPAPSPTPTLTPSPTPKPIPSPVRIRIPTINVDAPMVEMGVTPDGQVEEPRGPDEVSWSNGGTKPGAVGNAILSGHYDWSIPQPRGAVFFRLRELKVGDKVTISLEDESELNYKVVTSTLYLASTAPSEQILAQTPDEIITMITCEGTFYRDSRDYSHRRVVVARRVPS